MAKKPPRVSMKALDAEAFFAPPTGIEIEMAQEPNTGTPGDRQASGAAFQETSKIGTQDIRKPAYMKATYFITVEQDRKLERLRLARRGQGESIDKSALIREAIDRLAEEND